MYHLHNLRTDFLSLDLTQQSMIIQKRRELRTSVQTKVMEGTGSARVKSSVGSNRTAPARKATAADLKALDSDTLAKLLEMAKKITPPIDNEEEN